jgi:predicted transcriptional regulator
LEGLSIAELIVEMAAFVSDERQRRLGKLRERLAKADRGEFLSDEEASARLATILHN